MKKSKVISVLLCSVLLALLFMPYVHGQEAEEPVVLTYEEAQQKALSDILTVQDIDNIIREMQGQRRDLQGAVRDTPTSSARRREAQRDLNEFDRNIQGLRIQQEQAKTMAEFTLVRTIASIAEHGLRLELLEADLAQAEDGLRRMEVMHEFGLASDRDLRSAQYNIAQYHTRLEESLRGKESLRQELNALLGLPLYQYTLVEHDMALPVFPEDLDLYIQAMVQEAPSIRNLQLEVYSALDDRWVYTGNHRDIVISARDRQRAWADTRTTGETGTREPTQEILRLRNRLALQEAVERAIQERDQAKQILEANIRQGFTDLYNLFVRQETLETQLSQAEDALDTILIEYNLGRITRVDVERARLAIQRAEQDIELLSVQKWVQGFRLANPSLL